MNPGGQLHNGLWLITWHLAPNPQAPGQGSLHFWLLHASFWLQSEFAVHSGLHRGGEPINVDIQEHTAWLLISLHWLFGPHGEGLQG